MTKPAKLKFTIYQGATFRKRLRWTNKPAGGAVKTENFDWAQLGLPEIPNDSCLFLIVVCSTTSTGTVRGQGKIAHG